MEHYTCKHFKLNPFLPTPQLHPSFDFFAISTLLDVRFVQFRAHYPSLYLSGSACIDFHGQIPSIGGVVEHTKSHCNFEIS